MKSQSVYGVHTEQMPLACGACSERQTHPPTKMRPQCLSTLTIMECISIEDHDGLETNDEFAGECHKQFMEFKLTGL
jgi:hypothetical protein